MRVRAAAIFLAVIAASIVPQSIAADWADPAKVLRIAFPIDVSGLDPAGTQETYASLVEQRIFDALYVWDYLARPYKFVPSIVAYGRSASGGGSILPTTPPLRATSANSPRRISSTRGNASSIRAYARPTRTCSNTRSSG
jgi:hypothetical protein